jgi:hypothetical protein
VAIALLMIAAVVMLCLTWTTSPSRALICLVGTAILYQAISAFLLAVAHQHMQPQRAATLLWATAAASLPVAVEMWGKSTTIDFLRVPRRVVQGAIAAIAAGLLLPVLAISSEFATQMLDSDLVSAAHPNFNPSVSQELATTITTTAGRPAEDLVVLTDNSELLATHAFWGFLPWNVHYAHPDARVPDRIAFLSAAASCPDPACFDLAMSSGTFERINVIVAHEDANGTLQLASQLPGFPEPRPVGFEFHRRLFTPQEWTRQTVAGYAVLVAVK